MERRFPAELSVVLLVSQRVFPANSTHGSLVGEAKVDLFELTRPL